MNIYENSQLVNTVGVGNSNIITMPVITVIAKEKIKLTCLTWLRLCLSSI